MRGTYNPKTRRYEDECGNDISDYSKEEAEEMKIIKKIEAEGGTYLERYAAELKVDEADLLKNILDNNSMERFNNVNTYFEFTMLKQTLVKENVAIRRLKAWTGIIDGCY